MTESKITQINPPWSVDGSTAIVIHSTFHLHLMIYC